MLAKILIIGALLAILYALGSAFFFMIRDQGKGGRAVRRLGWRVGLSIGLLLAIMLAAQMGWIQLGNSVPIRYPAATSEDAGG